MFLFVSIARRNRSSFSINNNTADGAFSSIHSLPGIGVSGATGCGDVQLSVRPESTSTFFSCHNAIENVIDTKTPAGKKMDDGGQNTYVRVLKALLCVGKIFWFFIPSALSIAPLAGSRIHQRLNSENDFWIPSAFECSSTKLYSIYGLI